MRSKDCAPKMADSLWERTAAAAPALDLLQGKRAVDVAIIGGGFTGLSAAIHLAERGASVALVEAEVLGFGASGRNGGFIVPHFARTDPDQVIGDLGEAGERLVKLVGHSAQALFDLVRRYDISCDALQGGWFQPAHSREAMRMVEERCRQWAARGQPVRLHDAAATAKLTGCRGYYGSWSHAQGGTVHPLKFVRGLAQAATGLGAALFEHSPVHTLRRDGTRWLVETENGLLTAEKVLVCTNALSQGILPQLARTVIPVNIYQAATTAISGPEREPLLHQGQCLSDTRLDLFTYRFDADWRLISGSFVVLEPGARARLSRRMAARLQWMLGLQQTPAIEFIWRGTAAVSPGTLPALYEPAPGVLAGTGCNGRGIALCTELGRVMAELAMGAPSKSSAVPIRPLRSHRWRSLSRWGARYYALYGRIQDKLTQT